MPPFVVVAAKITVLAPQIFSGDWAMVMVRWSFAYTKTVNGFDVTRQEVLPMLVACAAASLYMYVPALTGVAV